VPCWVFVLICVQILSQGSATAHFLRTQLGLRHGDRVVLSFPPGLDFLVTFVACITQGIIAVPVYPPGPASFKRDMDRLGLICKASGAEVVLTSTGYEGVVTALKWKTFLTGGGRVSGVKWQSVPDACFKEGQGLALQVVEVKPEDVAFLQFTSGSTGDPKGVMVTHGALSHNLSSCKLLVGNENTTMVSWMPQYHE